MEGGADDGFAVPSQVPSHSGERVKLVNDSVHSHLELQSYVLDVLDTPTVQRLRDLKQLGSTYYVFPGASHNRFEHVVGTSFLAGEFVRGLYSNPRDPYIRTQVFETARQFSETVKLVEIAGLCHDLGHGPFSHSWDYVFLPKVTRHGDVRFAAPAATPSVRRRSEAGTLLTFSSCRSPRVDRSFSSTQTCTTRRGPSCCSSIAATRTTLTWSARKFGPCVP
jgi:hypothetical protein